MVAARKKSLSKKSAAKPAKRVAKLKGLTPAQAYKDLIAYWKRLATFGSVGSLLGWDQRTYMPSGASSHRAEQLALMSGMYHEMATSPHVKDLIAAAGELPAAKKEDTVEAVNVREIRREYGMATKLPQTLVEELSRATSRAYDVWVEARKQNDFNTFKSHLETIVGLTRKRADALGWKASRYDALLDEYEPGATKAEIEQIFAPLRTELAQLVGEIVSSGRQPDPKILNADYPAAAQEKFCKEAAAQIGFDFNCGRLDTTTHPFCSGVGVGDTRLTTRYNPHDFSGALFGTLHEAGHGIYDQGLEAKHYGSPMGNSVSLGIHESQSRMWENFVGRSLAFWKYFYPKLRETFPQALSGVGLDALYFAINKSQPSFIRVESDEATYNLHIILRFELESALIEGSLKAADVPGEWNARFKKLFGLEVPDNRRGCLQDVHWSGGGIGYFPTYTLGNLYAAQLFEQARKDLGDLDGQFSAGEFQPLKGWLNQKVHHQGMRFRSNKLCEKVTGKPLDHKYLMRHLRKKFGGLYGFSA